MGSLSYFIFLSLDVASILNVKLLDQKTQAHWALRSVWSPLFFRILFGFLKSEGRNANTACVAMSVWVFVLVCLFLATAVLCWTSRLLITPLHQWAAWGNYWHGRRAHISTACFCHNLSGGTDENSSRSLIYTALSTEGATDWISLDGLAVN